VIAARKIFNMAVKANLQGDVFPVSHLTIHIPDPIKLSARAQFRLVLDLLFLSPIVC
jgi:hypothetical protein